MTLDFIRKRNNQVVPFDRVRIEQAIEKACLAVGHSEVAFIPQLTSELIISLQEKYIVLGEDQIPSIEEVQDLVEEYLMKTGLYDVAKEYILYRASRIEERVEEVEEKIEEGRLYVLKRDGSKEAFDPVKVRKFFEVAAHGDTHIDVDALMKSFQTSVFDGISTRDIVNAAIMTAKALIEKDPQYSYLSAKLFLMNYYKELIGSADMKNSGFEKCYKEAFKYNLKFLVETEHLSDELLTFDLDRIADALVPDRDNLLAYLSVQNLYDRYFIHHEKARRELPQAFWMRVAMGLAIREKDKEKHAIEFYNVLSQLDFVSSTPTLFNSWTCRSQLSSCYLSTTNDSLEHIFKVIADDAQLSKWAGGLGNDWTNVRATGSYIKGTNGASQGVIPFLKIANDTAVAVNQWGKRKGALCTYLECWHLDFLDFLELRKNTGDERRRTHDMHTASWIPDLFMQRVEQDADWTLFTPSEAPDLHHIYGSAFKRRYEEYEQMAATGKIHLSKTLKARDIWRKMVSMLFETGHPWMTWKDPSNIRSPQDHVGVVHNSNLCTEITLNTSSEETAVCNLGSVNLSKHLTPDGQLDETKIAATVRMGMRMLDNVIDINFYPTVEARTSNMRHRPVGLGVMGLADALFALDIHFDSEAAVTFNDRMQEMISYYAILASSELALERGTYESYPGSKWDRGIFPLDTLALLETERGEMLKVDKNAHMDWSVVRSHVAAHGMRNSNTMAIAPTATISNIAGCFPCIEPIYKNIYVKSNLSGEFTVINNYLVKDLKAIGLWTEQVINKIKFFDGSIQKIEEIPQRLRDKYKEVFEIEPEWVIKAAAVRGKWIDQSQSVNIFIRGTSGKLISDTYIMAWKYGLKTTYYLRTLGASSIEKSTVQQHKGVDTPSDENSRTGTSAGIGLETSASAGTAQELVSFVSTQAPVVSTAQVPVQAAATTPEPTKPTYTPQQKLMCSILNGPDCEACQ